jgi:hypothetical protein
MVVHKNVEPFEAVIEPQPVGSAMGAARTAKRIRNRPAPHSVLRKFLRSGMPAWRGHTSEELCAMPVVSGRLGKPRSGSRPIGQWCC